MVILPCIWILPMWIQLHGGESVWISSAVKGGDCVDLESTSIRSGQDGLMLWRCIYMISSIYSWDPFLRFILLPDGHTKAALLKDIRRWKPCPRFCIAFEYGGGTVLLFISKFLIRHFSLSCCLGWNLDTCDWWWRSSRVRLERLLFIRIGRDGWLCCEKLRIQRSECRRW